MGIRPPTSRLQDRICKWPIHTHKSCLTSLVNRKYTHCENKYEILPSVGFEPVSGILLQPSYCPWSQKLGSMVGSGLNVRAGGVCVCVCAAGTCSCPHLPPWRSRRTSEGQAWVPWVKAWVKAAEASRLLHGSSCVCPWLPLTQAGEMMASPFFNSMEISDRCKTEG